MTDTNRRLQITKRQFDDLMTELARRGRGHRESGAFLLARRVSASASAEDGPLDVVAIAYYDDLDPDCLTGAIAFSGSGYAVLNARCRADDLRVVGDIHTHPSTWVQQSAIDAAHPMVAKSGHVALIAPNYGRGRIALEDIGAHVFEGPGWTSFFGDQVSTVVSVTGLTATAWFAIWVRTAVDRVRVALTRRGSNRHA
ncbi:hypothetical protein [Mycolicibacterium phocaicum]|uniref:hypothetical protein n=1 Tax=Mycolicibacterium phocaicum TaxID=319706 RepID=UPI0010FDB99F|nr:hypothetical protein [Mycolicibacterium phocaicum]BBZ58168.1 hypothetical protein MPHO_51600 [Mycolicibacterium phocaicum]